MRTDQPQGPHAITLIRSSLRQHRLGLTRDVLRTRRSSPSPANANTPFYSGLQLQKMGGLPGSRARIRWLRASHSLKCPFSPQIIRNKKDPTGQPVAHPSIIRT